MKATRHQARFARRFLPALFASLVLLLSSTIVGAAEPVDVIVYGDHIPATKLGGQNFVNPFTERDLAGEPLTRILVKDVPGIARPLGTVGWGSAAWAKYFFIAAYDEKGAGVFQTVSDQQIGVFDTEKHQFCQLDLDPAATPNAGVEFFAVADPGSRQSRIFFQGYDRGGGYAFGYVEGDLDNDAPCDPVNGWNVVGFTAADLDAAAVAAGLPPAKSPCAGLVTCGLDGIGLVEHDAAAGADTIVLNNWLGGKIITATVDAAGALAVPDVYVVPAWKPLNNGNACYQLRPVSLPAVDETRPVGDERFLYSFDVTCDAPVDTQSCSYVGLCPLAGTSCTIGQNSCGKYCDRSFNGTYVACTTSSTCDFLFGSGVACTDACKAVNPHQVCSNSTTTTCAQAKNCPTPTPGPTKTPKPGATTTPTPAGSPTPTATAVITCDCKPPGIPAQEFSFDGATIATTSGFFQTAQDRGTSCLAAYGHDGSLWVRDEVCATCAPTSAKGPVVYRALAGEHAYYDPAAPATSVVVAEDDDVGFTHDTSSWLVHVFDTASHAAPHPDGGAVYLVGRKSLQRALQNPDGSWTRDAGYKLALGAKTLPNEPRLCVGGANDHHACLVASECPGGACTVDESAVGESFVVGMSIGGSPPSVWKSPGLLLLNGAKAGGTMNSWLVRVPLASELPDGSSTTRPGVAWANERLWLVAEHGGGLAYRLRDGGLWSAWSPLPSNVAIAGGVSIAANDTGTLIGLFGRGTADGRIYMSSLLSGTDCAAGTCLWSNWAVLPISSLPTDAAPAAAFRGTSDLVVAIRSSGDNKIYYTLKNGLGAWQEWRVANTSFVATGEPGVAWNPSQSKTWLVAREGATGAVKYATVNTAGTTTSAWSPVAAASAPTALAASPAIVWDGNGMRIFAPASSPSTAVYQTIYAGGWSKWRPVPTETTTSAQPMPVNVHDEVELHTLVGDTLVVEALE